MSELSENEKQQKLQEFKAQLATTDYDPNDRTKNDDMLFRFLRARNYDIPKTLEMYLKYLSWLEEFKPQSTTEEMILEVLQKEICYFHYYDKNKYPTLLMFASRHSPKNRSVDLCIRFGLFIVEKAFAITDPPYDRVSAIIDYSGFSMSNIDMPLAKDMLFVLQNYYPERLGTVYIVNHPWMLGKLWNVLKKMVDVNTTRKIVFVEDNSDLLQFFDKEHLPPFLGGTSSYVHPGGSSIGFETILS